MTGVHLTQLKHPQVAPEMSDQANATTEFLGALDVVDAPSGCESEFETAGVPVQWHLRRCV